MLMLVIGVAIGSVSFPMTEFVAKTTTSTEVNQVTQIVFVTTTIHNSSISSFFITRTVSGSSNLNSSCNTFVGCVPIDEPVIVNAFVNQSSPSIAMYCGVATQGYPLWAVCDVTLSAGTIGSIILNLTSQNGNSSVAFGTFSTESQYVQFSSNYPCQYSTSPPDYNTARCPVLGVGSTYTFRYAVSQSLPMSTTEALLIISVTKTCCWP